LTFRDHFTVYVPVIAGTWCAYSWGWPGWVHLVSGYCRYDLCRWSLIGVLTRTGIK